MTKGKQLSYFLCGLLLSTVLGDPCIYKECYCDYSGIFCGERSLTAVPERDPNYNTQVDQLDLSVNLITTIPNGSLPGNLKIIDLTENPLTSIDDNAFDGSATTLYSLQFSHAQFTKLPEALSHLKNLTEFSISDSNVSDWNVDVIKRLGQTLRSFNVENCGITAWPDWVQFLVQVSDISISRNHISFIPDNGLDNLTSSVVSLGLANNNLTSVPKALSKLTALESLDLQGNKISDVTWLPHGSKLKSLSLSSNNIANAGQLTTAVLPYMNSLTQLDFNNNRLTAIPMLGFLAGIEALDFSHNDISDPLSGSLPPGVFKLSFEHNMFPFAPEVLLSAKNVGDMVLSWNGIRELRPFDFPPWTIGVELGYNLITELTDTNFPVNSSVTLLRLNNNPLSKISNNAFKNLPSLFGLYLQNTKLTRLPLGLASATNLHALDLTDSSYLVCTCLEASLYTWIMRLDNVAGDCGVSKIYDFFKIFSQSCPT